ncbi:MAG: copper resistance D family protein [Acidobacteriota bacterium]
MIYVIVEWVQLICLTFCIGIIVCRLWFFTPSMQTEFSYEGNFGAGLWKLFCFGLAFLIVGSVAGLIGRSVEMSGQPVSEISSVLPRVLFKTHYGTVWFVRIGALILLAISKTVTLYRDRRTFLVFMFVLALAVSMTASASGHGADTGDFSIPEIMDWLHLIAACLWGGGLMVLAFSVLPDLIGQGKGSQPLISGVAGRFSTMAGVAVAVIVITAVYNFLLDVGSVRPMVETPYGLTVAAKIFLLLILLNFGAFNRYVSVPLLQEWAGTSAEGRGVITRIAIRFFPMLQLEGNGGKVASRFMRSVKVEAVLIVGLLLCAALLRHEVPARHLHHMGHADGKPMHMHQGEGGPPAAPEHPKHEGN